MGKQSSNNTIYFVTGGIIVLAIIGFVGYKLWHHFNKGSALQYANTTTLKNSISQSPSQGAPKGSSGLSNKTDTSNQQLDQDVQNIQNSMNQLQQDQNTAKQDTGSQSQDVPQQ